MYSVCTANNFAVKEPIKHCALCLESYISMNSLSYFTVTSFEVLDFQVILLFLSEHTSTH